MANYKIYMGNDITDNGMLICCYSNKLPFLCFCSLEEFTALLTMPRRANLLADNARKAREACKMVKIDQTADLMSLPGPSGIPPDTFTNLI